MRKTKYFIMGFIFLLFLNSCGYLPYIYEQAVVAAGGNPYKDPKPKKDAPNFIILKTTKKKQYYGYQKELFTVKEKIY